MLLYQYNTGISFTEVHCTEKQVQRDKENKSKNEEGTKFQPPLVKKHFMTSQKFHAYQVFVNDSTKRHAASEEQLKEKIKNYWWFYGSNLSQEDSVNPNTKKVCNTVRGEQSPTTLIPNTEMLFT